jgi:abnormal spindle-like microcephaly-associated protein
MAQLAAIALLHRTARLVQDRTRFRLLLRRRAAAAHRLAGVARTIAAVKRLARIKWAVGRLQARSRARRVRARAYARRPELVEIAQRAAKARAAALADPRLWICNRTNVALETLLTSKNLGDVLRAVSSLEMFTLIARNVCLQMVERGAVPVVFTLLATCNRSTPHQKIVGHGLRALTNMAKLASLQAELCAQPKSLTTLVDLAQGYRDKASHELMWNVLQLLCELVLRGPASWRDKLIASSTGADVIKRLEALHGLLARAVLKEGGNTPAAGGPRRASAAPSAASKAKAGGKVAPNKVGGAAGASGKVAAVELAPKCVGALKAVLTALGK